MCVTELCREAEERVLRYLPMSKALAVRFAGRGIPVEDLQQVAAMALTEAAGRFDESRGVSFPAYAAPTIIGALRHELRDHADLIRTPEKIRTELARLYRTAARLEQELFRTPTTQEVAAAVGITEEDALSLLLFSRQNDTVSLEAPTEEEKLTLSSILGREDAAIREMENAEELSSLLASFRDKDRELIRLRYHEQLSQRETARLLDMTQVQVSRREQRLLLYLRQALTDVSPTTMKAGG